MIYCPKAKTRTIIVKRVISYTDDLSPPIDVTMPTMELSTITATTITIIVMRMLLWPILNIC